MNGGRTQLVATEAQREKEKDNSGNGNMTGERGKTERSCGQKETRNVVVNTHLAEAPGVGPGPA